MKINGITFGVLSMCVGFWLGCAGYQTGLTAGAHSVQIQFFENETFEPRLATAVNRALKREFQKDGTYSLETQSEGDFVVTGKLIDFRRNGVSYKPGDVLTVQDYTMELHYFYRPASITTVSSGTTWLGDNAELALLYGALVEAYTFMKGEDQLLNIYNGRYQESLQWLKNLGEGKQTRDQYRYDRVRRDVA